MAKTVKNFGKSVKTRLLNLMKQTDYPYMYLLARYFNERLLYRVSISSYKSNFLLKGGLLLYAINGLETRPTTDVDFMAQHISRDRAYLDKVFREILCIPCQEDGVVFDLDTLRAEPIAIDKLYPGTRFFVTAKMDTIVYPMTMDIGFGDIVSPASVSVDFPILLKDVPAINIQAYSLETVVAEKFHAMIVRDVSNSRMKDFFDCYQILSYQSFEEESLYEAIKATFDNRGLEYNQDLQLFTEDFANNPVRIQQWNAFVKKIHWKEVLEFPTVMNSLTEYLKPFLLRYWNHPSSL